MVKTHMAVSVIVPVYNEEASILSTIQQLHDHLRATGRDYEIIVVNDGSTDTGGLILDQCQDCRVVHHESRRGYGAALKTGIRLASYPLVAILDADGTYPIGRLSDLIQLAERQDMVVGKRVNASFSQLWLRQLAKWFLTRFAELLVGQAIPDLNSGMRVFRKQFFEQHEHVFPDGFSFTTTITLGMLNDGRRVRFEPILYAQRVGRSKIRPIADTWNMARTIIRTTYHFAPGRIIVPVATTCSFLLALGLAWNAILVPQASDKVILMLANLIQLGFVILMSEMLHRRAEPSR